MIRDMILKNRTYRRFDESAEIGREQLEAWVDLARLSSSGANLQPLKYLLVTGKQDREKLFSRLKWAGYLKDWDGPVPGERPSAYVVMVLDKAVSTNPWWDHGIAAWSILLGAVEAGFGGCMFGAVDKAGVKADFGLSDTHEVMMVIALGKPVERVVLEDVRNGDIKYYRDAEGVHHVPKRKLEDLILDR